MKSKFLFVVIIIVLLGNRALLSNEPTGGFELQKVDMTKISQLQNVYVIDSEEVLIETDLIKRISFGWNGTQITVSMRNLTNSKKRPDFKITFYNAYGMKIDTCSLRWLLDEMEPEQAYTDITSAKVKFDNELKDLFQYSSINFPPDIERARYLVITGSCF